MVFYEKTISLISTKYDSEESVPTDNKGTGFLSAPSISTLSSVESTKS